MYLILWNTVPNELSLSLSSLLSLYLHDKYVRCMTNSLLIDMLDALACTRPTIPETLRNQSNMYSLVIWFRMKGLVTLKHALSRHLGSRTKTREREYKRIAFSTSLSRVCTPHTHTHTNTHARAHTHTQTHTRYMRQRNKGRRIREATTLLIP